MDERAGRWVSDDSGYQKVRARLIERADVTTTRANERLEVVRRSYEVDERELLQTQREMGRQTADGLAPSTAEFWRSHASPRAERLADASKAVIDEEFEELAAATVRFRRSIRSLGVIAPATYAQAEADLSAALDLVATIALDPEPLNQLGERFQRRLRRTASLQLLPGSLLISPAETERIIDRAEIDLLDHAPYTYCDKLLVAFELSHADIRSYVREHTKRLRLVSSRKLRGELRDLG